MNRLGCPTRQTSHLRHQPQKRGSFWLRPGKKKLFFEFGSFPGKASLWKECGGVSPSEQSSQALLAPFCPIFQTLPRISTPLRPSSESQLSLVRCGRCGAVRCGAVRCGAGMLPPPRSIQVDSFHAPECNKLQDQGRTRRRRGRTGLFLLWILWRFSLCRRKRTDRFPLLPQQQERITYLPAWPVLGGFPLH